MIYIFLGAPGTGKGTVSDYLSKNNNFVHISTGNIFRKITSSNSDLSKKIKEIIDSGKLIDDELTFEVLKQELKNYDLISEKIILDGFPRTIKQAELLDEYLKEKNIKIKKTINLNLSEEDIIKRLSGRLTCPKCSKVYNKFSEDKKPKKLNFCDADEEKLITRKDDQIENIKVRLKNYYDKTEKLISFYEKRKELLEIDSNKDITEIAKIIIESKNIK